MADARLRLTANEERRGATADGRRVAADRRQGEPADPPGSPEAQELEARRGSPMDDLFGDGLDAEAVPIRPKRTTPTPNVSAERRRRSWIFNLSVTFLPVIVAAIYLFGFASNVYQVESVIAIRNPMATGASGGGGIMAAITGAGSAAAARAIDESYAVIRYVQSREAFDEVEKRLNLRKHFDQNQYNWFQRLDDEAGYERYFRYYTSSINIFYDDLEGKILLSTYAFDAKTAYDFNKAITDMSERLVNTFNERALNDSVAAARGQADRAGKELQRISDELTTFRLDNRVINPETSSTALNTIITSLEAQSSATQAEIRALSTMSGGAAPRLAELKNKLSAIYAQITTEQQRLTGKANALAPVMQRYNFLTVEQTIAQQLYVGALTALETTILTAQRAKLYVVNVVTPDVPPEPRHPRKLFILGITLAVSFVVCLILRLVIAAIRDHMV